MQHNQRYRTRRPHYSQCNMTTGSLVGDLGVRYRGALEQGIKPPTTRYDNSPFNAFVGPFWV